jgi:hypothetical protein
MEFPGVKALDGAGCPFTGAPRSPRRRGFDLAVGISLTAAPSGWDEPIESLK